MAKKKTPVARKKASKPVVAPRARVGVVVGGKGREATNSNSEPLQPKPRKKPGGQKGNPGRTAESEIEERIAICREMLEGHCTKSEIKKAMRQQFGADARTVERYLSRAREDILKEISDTRDFFRAQSLAAYRNVLKSPEATIKDRILAQRQTDHLLGLHAPWKVAQTDTNGRDIPPDEARDRISSLASRVAERIREAGVDRLPSGGGT